MARTLERGINMKDKWVLPACFALAIFAVFCCLVPGADDSKRSDSDEASVAMKSLSFSPKKLEIRIGDSVVWNNEARTKHTATSDDDGKTFNTGEIEAGKSSKPVKFEKAGEFKYHCKVHGNTMSGTVVVKAKAK
jgi:plastocyanin